LYQTIVGLITYYATMTRPDLAFSAQALGRHMQATGPEHLRAAKRVMRYIQGTKQLGLTYGGDLGESTQLVGLVDSDYASDLDSRRSTTGYIFAVGGGVVSYNSKRQPSVALSSAFSVRFCDFVIGFRLLERR
jgi:hypothetical protein